MVDGVKAIDPYIGDGVTWGDGLMWAYNTPQSAGTTLSGSMTLTGSFDTSKRNTLEFLSSYLGSDYKRLEVATVPEPATLSLPALFGGGMLFVRRFFSA
ncbi:hypothetical protein ACFLQY_01440 [Verrucomicrobiota bacterium]